MPKRRVYEPIRDEGWSNGKYWKPKRRHEYDDEDEDLYDAFCEDCDCSTPHQWDECVMCTAKERIAAADEKVDRDEDLDAFGRDIADH